MHFLWSYSKVIFSGRIGHKKVIIKLGQDHNMENTSFYCESPLISYWSSIVFSISFECQINIKFSRSLSKVIKVIQRSLLNLIKTLIWRMSLYNIKNFLIDPWNFIVLTNLWHTVKKLLTYMKCIFCGHIQRSFSLVT